MALATRPLLHQLYATVHQMLRTAHDKMPIWSSAAAMAFMGECVSVHVHADRFCCGRVGPARFACHRSLSRLIPRSQQLAGPVP